MADVRFENFSIQVMNALDDAAIQFLEEAASEIQSQAQRNTNVGRVNGGKTKGDWEHIIDESRHEATIGNNNENAVWEEFGTGEYALDGKGIKGGWYIPIGNGRGKISQAVVDAYNMKVVYGKDGVKFAYTKGKKPKRMLHNAFEAKKSAIKRRAEQIFRERMN